MSNSLRQTSSYHSHGTDSAGLPPFKKDAWSGDLLSAHIADSWERCRGFGLKSDLRPCLEPIAGSEIRVLLDRDHSLAQAARREVNTLSAALANTGHVVVMVDDQGFIVDAGGDTSHAGVLLKHARLGLDLRETNFGTTAPVAALVEHRPVYVRRGEHFLRDLQFMECLAVPISLPDGAIAGALGISSDTHPLLPGLMDLVQNSLMRIEGQLMRGLGSSMMLHLHPHPDCIGTPLEGLVALGEDFEVLGLNSVGARLLGVKQADAVGRLLNDQLDGNLQLCAKDSSRRMLIRARTGMSLFAKLSKVQNLTELSPRLFATSGTASIGSQGHDTLRERLTEREITVMQLLDSGFSNKEIGESLLVSENTVKFHLKNVFSKLNVRSRVEAIGLARQLNLLE